MTETSGVTICKKSAIAASLAALVLGATTIRCHNICQVGQDEFIVSVVKA